MSQILSQSLGQHMRLEQRLTPQLIQSMAILQKPVADLEAYVAEALESNAALELEEPTAEIAGQGKSTPERSAKEGEDGAFARLERFGRDHDMDWVDRPPTQVRRVGSDDRDAKMAAMANTEGRESSLHDNLLEQWTLVDAEPDVRRAGEAIINHLDPDGYLRIRLDEIAERVRPPLAVEPLERALQEIHHLEPAGIGARDVVECLLLQLDALPGDNRIERTLIEHHLDDITHNRLPAVAKATGRSVRLWEWVKTRRGSSDSRAAAASSAP